MKRNVFAVLFSALFAGHAVASTNPPMAALKGWQVFGPSGSPASVTNLSPPLAAVAALTQEEVNEALRMQPPATPLQTASADIGLPTDLPADSAEMIAELARALDYNWLLCYTFVRDNIRFAPYAGIVRGPKRTLIDREGNSADQAFLLLALLRAYGYEATVYFDPYFYMPFANSANGYDAASWLGVSPTGTVTEIKDRLNDILEPGGLNPLFSPQSTPQTSILFVDHFFVGVSVPGYGYHLLDPSYKPRRRTSPDSAAISAMGYSRSALLEQAGGTVTNQWFAQGMSMTALTNELLRLTTNLTARLRADASPGGIAGFLGQNETVPQDFSVDASTFHGYYYDPSDFLSLADADKNAQRAWIWIANQGVARTIWLDELADRRLWLSYTNIAGFNYPGAVLHLDGTVLTQEVAGASTEDDTFVIGVHHPSLGGGNWVYDTYSLKRAVTNVYAIPLGFGSEAAGGMRETVTRKLAEQGGSGWLERRATLLHSLGQQWLYQCAKINSLLSRVGGYSYHAFFETGIVGHKGSSYFDFKTGADFTSAATTPALYGGRIFTSALEHSVLDQNNGVGHPAISTVRVIELANSGGTPLYLTSSNNWATVKPALLNAGYSAGLVAQMEAWVGEGQSLFLPGNGEITLNDWSGTGFFMYGPKGTGSLLSGGIGGADPSVLWTTLDSDVLDAMTRPLNENGAVRPVKSADPVDMREGAALIDRTDLVFGGPSSLHWRRHYDSRQRHGNGSVGRGWSHGYDARVTVHSDPDSFMGGDLPASCAASVVACKVVDDLMSTNSAKTLAAVCLVTKWWADQLLNGAATVTAEGRSLTFARLPDGSYEPQPGVTATLTGSAPAGFTFEERLGPSWHFAANGRPSYVEDRSGNSIGFVYSNQTALVSVTNGFGAALGITWGGDKIVSVADSAGRSLSYAYSADGCLTGVTDVAGHGWSMAYDSEAGLCSETDPEGVVTVRNAYNGLGQVTNQLSASGNAWSFAYACGWRAWEADPLFNSVNHGFTAEGRPAWRLDRDGSFRQSFYDGLGQLATNIDALGRMTVSVFDSGNRLVRVTEAVGTPDARATAFAYDSGHRLVAVTNALGRVTRMGYDGCDRLVCVIAPDGVTVTNVYDSHGLLTLTRTLDASGRTVKETSSVYGSRGLATEITSTGAGTASFEYDGAGNVSKVTDARDQVTRFYYDGRGLLTNTVDAMGGSNARHFTPAGRLSAAVDPLGRTTAFLWTPAGKPAAAVHPDGGMTTNEFDVADRLAATRDARGSRVVFALDSMGRVTNRTASAWSDFAWYDAAGRVVARVDAVAGLTRTGYDNLDRLVAVTDPMGGAWTNSYDAVGALIEGRDPRGRTTVYARDPVSRLAVTRYPSGRTEGNAYDALGRVTAFTNAEGRVYRMSYDGQRRLTAATNAVGGQVFRNLFDLVGNLTNRIDGAGRGTGYSYDALNRRTEALYADGAWERFGYDAVGNLTAASNAASRLSFSYDAMNRLASSETRVAGQVFAVAYGCDRGGIVTNVTYPGGQRVRYGHDADGRVTNVTDWAGRSFTFTRDAAGRLTALSYPNGVSGSWMHDANYRVSGWSYNKGAPLAGRTITRDEAGVKIQEQVTSGLFPNPQSPRRAANTFDAADRLVSATLAVGTNSFAETYLYDGNGALTNRHSAAGDQQFEYDSAGRMTFASTGGATLSVTYDALGNRLTTYSANFTRIWITDHADPRKRPLMEADSNGVPVRYFVWGGGLLLAVVEADGAVHYAHNDEQGSVVALTDLNGAVTDQYCYGPYGTDWGHSGTNSIPFRWLGSHGVFNVGGSALYLTRYRAYDTGMGRFLSADPLGVGGGPNLYAYCMGSPLAYVDPLGLGAESGYDQHHSTISADTRPPSAFYSPDKIYDPLSDPDSRALMHANALLPESAIGKRLGDDMAESMLVQTFTAPGVAVISDSVLGAVARVFAPRATSLNLNTATSWGRPETLADHFARHGADFAATTADDYAGMAARFLQESQAARLPTKIDGQGVIRVFDPQTGTFGSFNPNGTTRTFFKPNSPTYFDQQPGTLVP